MDPLNETISSPPNTAFTASNYPDRKSVIAAYKRAVNLHLDSFQERSDLQNALKVFQRTQVVEELVDTLRPILAHPKKRGLYHYIRPLIPARMRPEYNSLLPIIPSYEQRVIHLKRKGAESVGISIRGGLEHTCGVFITSVQPSSRAAQVGLKVLHKLKLAKVSLQSITEKVGDEMVRINGMSLKQSTSVEVANLLKMKKSLTITCKTIGMLPQHDTATGHIVWKDVSDDKNRPAKSRLTSEAMSVVQSTKKLQLLVDGSSLGISIQTKLNSRRGVVIREVVPNSPADNAGLTTGDEIIQVDEHSVMGVSHEKAIELLTSKDSLMLTLRVDPTHAGANRTSLGSSSLMGMFTDPPDNFEVKPSEFDVDSEMTPDVQLHYKEAFLLKARDGEGEGRTAEGREERRESKPDPNYDRLSVLEMEADPNKGAPTIAFSQSFGFGPTIALPTLLQSFPHNEFEQDGEALKQEGTFPATQLPSATSPGLSLDESLISVSGLMSPEKPDGNGDQGSMRESAFLDMGNFSFRSPSNAANTSETQKPFEKAPENSPPKTTPPKEAPEVKLQVDLSPFQIPSSDESENEDDEPKVQPVSVTASKPPVFGFPDLTKKPHQSSLKKPSITNSQPPALPPRKTSRLGFRDTVEFIDERYSVASSGSTSIPEEHLVHPSNMEFSEDELKGRRVVFHTVPKTGPLMVGIRGGMDTGEDEEGVFISSIRQGGAAQRYGRLHVGDQILVVDGFVLLNVAHNDAVLSLQKAMNMESISIDLVVAVPKGVAIEEPPPPKTKERSSSSSEEEETGSSEDTD